MTVETLGKVFASSLNMLSIATDFFITATASDERTAATQGALRRFELLVWAHSTTVFGISGTVPIRKNSRPEADDPLIIRISS